MTHRPLIPLLLLAVCLFCEVGPCLANEYIPTRLTGFTSNGHTMFPFRALMEWMGAQVDWNSAGQCVTARRGGVTMVLWVGRSEAKVNGRARSMGVAPALAMGLTFVPLRFVAEALGARVDWNPRAWQAVVWDHDDAGILSVARGGPEPMPSAGPLPPR